LLKKSADEGSHGNLECLGGAAAYWVFGAIWYISLSNPWLKATGIECDQKGRPKGNGSPMPFVLSAITMVIIYRLRAENRTSVPERRSGCSFPHTNRRLDRHSWYHPDGARSARHRGTASAPRVV
jgi:hypothetical protein